MSELTHFDDQGQAHMVNVGAKLSTARQAVAEGFIRMQVETFRLLEAGGHKKGDVLGIARIAAIMASKQTGMLIPLCHPINLTHVSVKFELLAEQSRVRIEVITETVGQTGVEMEALTAVNVGLLTIYDMCKAVDKGMVIEGVKLLEKHGGKSGDWYAVQE